MSSIKLVSRFSLLLGLGLSVAGAGAGAGAACSAATGVGEFTGSAGNGGSGAPSGSSGSLGQGGSVAFGDGGLATGSGSGTGGVAACAAEPFQAAQLPLDMYIMQDQSGSMSDMVSEGGTKWQAVTAAFTAFVEQPGLSGIDVGIQYFGVPPGGTMTCNLTCAQDSDCGGASCGPCLVIAGVGGLCLGGVATVGDSCAPSDYATPEVEIAPLPGVAAAIVQSLANHGPSTNTPTGPALQGAVDHAKAWAATHPGHVVIAVLATDGEPNECTPTDTAGLAQIAATALAGTPSIKTFTIGTFAPADIPTGPDLLDAIAAAGGTGKAFNIDTTVNVNQAFLAALNAIRGTALGCQYAIPVPEAGTPDFTKLNVQYTPGGGGTAVELPQVKDAAHCPASGDGWYYDDNSAPTQIDLCASTCSKVSADAKGAIDILLGCQTKTAT